MVKSGYAIKEVIEVNGYIQLTNKALRFFRFPVTGVDKRLYYELPLNDIKELMRIFSGNSYSYFCCYLKDNSSKLFRCLNEEDQHDITRKIVRMRKTAAFRLKYNSTLDPKKLMELEDLPKNWLQGNISNYDFLAKINYFASRNCGLFSKYPIYPIILKDYSSNKIEITNSNKFRNFDAGLNYYSHGSMSFLQ